MTTPGNTTVPEVDPLLSYESRPSVSFDQSKGGYAVKQRAVLLVQTYPKLIVDRDPETKEIKYWPPREGDTQRQPKQKLVINVVDQSDNGIEKTLWAKPVKKGKALFAALQAATRKVQADTGDKSYRLKPGDTLELMYIGDDMSVAPKMGNRPKMFAARIKVGTPPPPKEEADPFAEADAGSTPSQPASSSPAEQSDPWAEGGATAAGSTSDADPWGDVAGEGEPPF